MINEYLCFEHLDAIGAKPVDFDWHVEPLEGLGGGFNRGRFDSGFVSRDVILAKIKARVDAYRAKLAADKAEAAPAVSTKTAPVVSAEAAPVVSMEAARAPAVPTAIIKFAPFPVAIINIAITPGVAKTVTQSPPVIRERLVERITTKVQQIAVAKQQTPPSRQEVEKAINKEAEKKTLWPWLLAAGAAVYYGGGA